MTYCVVKYTRRGAFVGVVAGLGRNRGTWDTAHGRTSAYNHASKLNREDPHYTYKAERTA